MAPAGRSSVPAVGPSETEPRRLPAAGFSLSDAAIAGRSRRASPASTGENTMAAQEGAREPGLVTVVGASAAGTAFEWYDFFVFASLTPALGKHFFTGVNVVSCFFLVLVFFALGLSLFLFCRCCCF